jgi:hypothetical protein
VKATELEKAKAVADARVNELNAELANLRNGSELKEAIAQRKKAEADLSRLRRPARSERQAGRRPRPHRRAGRRESSPARTAPRHAEHLPELPRALSTG